jgi:Na+-driven multidrug efflux pump
MYIKHNFAPYERLYTILIGSFIIYAFSYPFKAAVKYIGSYFYACEETRLSNILIYADPLLLTPITLLLFSALFGMVGVWLSLTVSQLLLTILGAILLIVNKKGQNKIK